MTKIKTDLSEDSTLSPSALEQKRIARWYQIESHKILDAAYAANQKANKTTHGVKSKEIVVTPIEVVDYQVRSLILQCKEQYPEKWTYRSVHWHDPFAGSGIFMCRTMRILYDDEWYSSYDIKQAWEDGNFECWEITPIGAYICKVNMEREFRQITGEYPRLPALVYCRDTFEPDIRYGDMWDPFWGCVYRDSPNYKESL